MRNSILAGVLAILAVSTVQAAESGPYLGASFGNGTIEIGDFDADHTAYKIFGGYRFLPWLAVEAGWMDFGKPDQSFGDTKVEVSADGFTAFVVASYPVTDAFEVFGKVGGYLWELDATARTGDVVDTFDDDGGDLAWGAGLQLANGNVALRLEYEMAELDDTDAALLSLGVVYAF